MLTQPTVAPLPLPEWCSNYLLKASGALLTAAHDGAMHASVVSQALGFTRAGWSASKAFASDQKAIRAALLYQELRYHGMSATSAYERVGKEARLVEADSVRKLVRGGKRMLQHIPTPVRNVSDVKLSRQEARAVNTLMRAADAAKQHVLDCATSNTSQRNDRSRRG
jgi:hypothetical protein